MLRCRCPKKEGMSLSRRARVFRAPESTQPSWDVLQAAPPSVWLDVLRRACDSSDSDHDREGMRLFDASCNVDALFLALPRTQRKGGASDQASSEREPVRVRVRGAHLAQARFRGGDVSSIRTIPSCRGSRAPAAGPTRSDEVRNRHVRHGASLGPRVAPVPGSRGSLAWHVGCVPIGLVGEHVGALGRTDRGAPFRIVVVRTQVLEQSSCQA